MIHADSFDYIITIVLGIFIVILPFAHTATIKAICIVFLITLWLAKMAILRQWQIQRTPIDRFIFAYFLFGVISLFTSVDWITTIGSIKREMIINFILFYLITHNLKKPLNIKNILLTILLGNLIMMLYGHYDFFLVKKGNFNVHDIRFHSLSADFAFFSAYSVTIFPFVFIAMFYVKKFKHKGLTILLILANTLALYLNHQRGAWLAVTIGCFLTLLILKKWKAMSILLFFIAILFFFLPSSVLQHGEMIISSSGKVEIQQIGGSTTPRIEAWKFGLQRVQENLFLGYGLGRDNFAKKYPQLKEKFGPTHFHAHNIFLDISLQMGLGGLIVFILLIGKMLHLFWDSFRRNSNESRQYILLSVIIATVVFFIRNMFDTLFVSDSGSFIWILWGIGMSQCVEEKMTHG